MEQQQKSKVGRPRSPLTPSQREVARCKGKRAIEARHALEMLPPGTIKPGRVIWSNSTGEKRVCRSERLIDGTYILVERVGEPYAIPMEITDVSAYPRQRQTDEVSPRIKRFETLDPGRSLVSDRGAVERAMALIQTLDAQNGKTKKIDYSFASGADVDANIRATMERKYQDRLKKRNGASRQTA